MGSDDADVAPFPLSAATLLRRLLDEYEKGARFERADARDVLLRVDEDAFPAAFAPDGREALETLMADAATLERAGALQLVRKRRRGGGEDFELRLRPGDVPAAYAVAAAYGHQPLRHWLSLLQQLAERLHVAAAADPLAPSWWLGYLSRVRDGAVRADLRAVGVASRARLRTEWPEVRDAVIAADRLARTADAWARHVSEALFANSKRLTAIKGRVAGILRAADPRWEDAGGETSDPDDVLSAYGIRRRPPMITCAGAVPIRWPGGGGVARREYHLSDFAPVGVLPGAWADKLADAAVASGIRTITTIENEYPLFSYVEEAGGPEGLGARGELVIWSSGFVADHLLDLLARIAAGGGDAVTFRHWGDADPAGLAIWWQIRTTLNRPVSLYRTTADWVEQAARREGQPLTNADRRLLAAHGERFAAAGDTEDLQQAGALAQTLLRLGVKIEQERQ